jgi:hypothetical protein
MRLVWAVQFAILLAWAQSTPQKPAVPPAAPAALENSGKPMALKFQCTEEDIQAFGLGCSEEEPCPIYLELSGIESVGSQIFATGNIHSASATLYSILLSSSDNGKTWREAFERIRGASLDRILFIDFERGWAMGETVQPLPRDPFLLITTTGGKTWRRQAIFDDGRPGSIQQIWFDSRTTGSLVFDRGQSADGPRYEMYESATGGDNWMLREASEQPIKIKRMPAEIGNADWRLRADAASKSNRIEKRQGGKWSTVASFAVTLEACKPPQAKELEPPPEPTEQAQPQAAPNKGTLSLPELRGEKPSPKKK